MAHSKLGLFSVIRPAISWHPNLRKFSQKPKDAAKGATPKKAAKPKAKKERKASAIDGAAKVLGESKEPMNTMEMIDAMSAKGYWKSPGGHFLFPTCEDHFMTRESNIDERQTFVVDQNHLVRTVAMRDGRTYIQWTIDRRPRDRCRSAEKQKASAALTAAEVDTPLQLSTVARSRRLDQPKSGSFLRNCER
jgi:hypothetical protein